MGLQESSYVKKVGINSGMLSGNDGDWRSRLGGREGITICGSGRRTWGGCAAPGF